MTEPRPTAAKQPALTAALALVLALAGLTGCQSDPSATSGARSAAGSGEVGSRPSSLGGTPSSRAVTDPEHLRFMRVGLFLSEYEAAVADARMDQAEQVAAQIRGEVDGAPERFIAAARGQEGTEAQYVGILALGFSQRTGGVTEVLIEQLQNRDARLVANALTALSMRADPNTPLGALLPIVHPKVHPIPLRVAPLALANVLRARTAAGVPLPAPQQAEATTRARALIGSLDAETRLHTAKLLGAAGGPDAIDGLLVLIDDAQMRVRWAAAAALERSGDPRGFPEVVMLLHESPEESKTIIRDVLASYAARLSGRPLAAEEVAEMGTSAPAWSRWFSRYEQNTGRFPGA